ncbi:5'(3')-deoxyribonucleotidase, mitochondrial isoform X2 [Rhinopithecus roxellana]|uniref:5'(3')-deoxyribonucleotidase, mitochondrial isoform X2 n=1 Tax=Rhinopithecus roxellana TaxID=61622 RepID=UPI001237302C|nr:5'(3')-deoxyribonucleotidase, mitochondrial isoform X2 [Rhinopithecus roxellana]
MRQGAPVERGPRPPAEGGRQRRRSGDYISQRAPRGSRSPPLAAPAGGAGGARVSLLSVSERQKPRRLRAAGCGGAEPAGPLKRASSEDTLNKPGSTTASGVACLKKTATAGAISELAESRLRSGTGFRPRFCCLVCGLGQGSEPQLQNGQQQEHVLHQLPSALWALVILPAILREMLWDPIRQEGTPS